MTLLSVTGQEPPPPDLVPAASFVANATQVVVGQSVAFVDTTTGGNPPLAYSWTFGDNSPTTTTRNPVHQFVTNGTFTVILMVSDADGDTTGYPMQVVVAIDLNPLATLATNLTGTIARVGQVIQFSGGALGGNAPFTFRWSFGDGTAAQTGQVVTHAYASTGVYAIELQVTDTDGDVNRAQATVNVTTAGTAGGTNTGTGTTNNGTAGPGSFFQTPAGIVVVVAAVAGPLLVLAAVLVARKTRTPPVTLEPPTKPTPPPAP